MDLEVVTTFLPFALGLIMMGLGLSLTVEDFRRVGRNPRAVLIALTVQILILPPIAFGLVLLFGLQGLLAVGVLLLASSPGGATANLFSHLFRGDVALNISLTAVNSVLAVVTLPIITNLAIAYFLTDADGIGLQFDKALQVFAIVLLPVVIGMFVRHRWPAVAAGADKPVRIFSIVVLAALAIGALVSERELVAEYLGQVGVVVTLFCLISLSAGYGVSRLLRLTKRQAIAASMEIGVHNTTIAMTIGISVMGAIELAVPSAVYSFVMYICATLFGFAVTRLGKPDEADARAVAPA